MSEIEDSAPSCETIVSDLAPAIGQLIRRLRAEANPGELNLSQTSVLARLDQSGAMSTAELARAEAMKPQSMGTILGSLEQEGLVKRQPHKTDGRQVLFVLTAQGIETRRKRTIAKREWLLTAFLKLAPDEQRALAVAIPLIQRLGDA